MIRHDYGHVPSQGYQAARLPDDSPHARLYGVEIELDIPRGKRRRLAYTAEMALHGLPYAVDESRWHATRDGSLWREGIECVSHPASLAWWQKGDWAQSALPLLLPKDWIPCATCGMHVHASCTEQEVIKSVCKIWTSCPRDGDVSPYAKLGRRRSWRRFRRYASPYEDTHGRYAACAPADHGVEVRIFASTRRVDTIIANITLVSLSFGYARWIVNQPPDSLSADPYTLVGFREYARTQADAGNIWDKRAFGRLWHATRVPTPTAAATVASVA